MTTEIRTVATSAPQVFRQPQGRSFLGVTGGAGAGTILLEYSNDGVNFTPAPQGVQLSPYSFCPDSFGVQQQGYVRATAGVVAGFCIASDYSQVRQGQGGLQQPVIDAISVPLVTQVALTTEQIIWSRRFPAGYLPANWQAQVDLQFGASNNANVKTLKMYFGPTGNAGTFLASIALTSLLNGRLIIDAYGGNDFVTVKGGSVGAGATAVVSTAIANWALAEQEWCLTVTKATAADTVTIDRLRASVFTQ